MNRRRRRIILPCLALVTVLLLLTAPFIGMTPISPEVLLGGTGKEYEIFWRIRVPRVLAAWIAGGGLAAAGMAFQALFRNPLATPFTLGVASGAALGAAVSIRAGLSIVFLGVSSTSLAAFAGAVLSVLLVYGLSRIRAPLTTSTLLLAGVAVNFFFTSLNLFTQYISDFTHTYRIIRWLMGGVEVTGFDSVFQMAPFAVLGILLIAFQYRELDLLSTDEEIAVGRGVNVPGIQNILFFASSLVVGGVVAVCGPIGFVGIMAPHICRLMVGTQHSYLIPSTVLFGGSFLLLCDTLARTIIAPAELPVGVITALLGGPFFLWLLLWGEKRG